MIDTTSITAVDESTLATWPSVEPDRYLDARQPGWEHRERAGLVRCARLRAARGPRVYIDAAATEIIEALLAPRMAEAAVADSQPTGALRADA